MPNLFRHPKTQVWYYRKVVPPHLRDVMGRGEIRRSLGTKDKKEAQRLYSDVARDVDALLARAARSPDHLSNTEDLLLAWKWRNTLLAEGDQEAGFRERILEWCADDLPLAFGQVEALAGSPRVPQVVAQILEREELELDRDGQQRLTEAVLREYQKVLRTCRFWTEADPQSHEQRPKAQGLPPTPRDAVPMFDKKGGSDGGGKLRAAKRSAIFRALSEGWARERRPAGRTRLDFERALRRLEAHVGHDDAAKLTRSDLVAWKDALLEAGHSSKTIFNHLAAVNAVFGWAVKNDRLPANPAFGVSIQVKSKPSERRLPFDDRDATLILAAARREKGAKRWIPWLLAFSGARLDEVCQALVADIREKDGIWHLDINADHPTKTLKNEGSARQIPLHSAVIEEGFLDYLRSLSQDGPLFPDLSPDRFGRRGGNGTKILGRWVRSLGITDKRKAPSHSWRHRFKDECRNAGIETSVHDALTGHAAGTVGAGYGLGPSLAVRAAAIEKLRLPPGMRSSARGSQQPVEVPADAEA